MKRTIFLSMLIALMLTSATTVCAQFKVKPFEHLSVSVNAGTLGAGVQVATPVNRYLSLRTGIMMFSYTYNYDYDGIIHDESTYFDDANIPMKAKANMVNGLLLADIFPFHNQRFHLSGGFYMGTSELIKVSTRAAANRPVEIGDVIIRPGENGNVAAHLKTKGFKPYAGIGFGSSVTKRNRIGFKFELGAMFHGNPKIVVTEGRDITDDTNVEASEKLSSVNDFLKNFNVYPVLNFQLNFRAF